MSSEERLGVRERAKFILEGEGRFVLGWRGMGEEAAFLLGPSPFPGIPTLYSRGAM